MIKNKEFKDFEFQQKLRLKFTENNGMSKNEIFTHLWFDSAKIEFNVTNNTNVMNISELHVNIQQNQVSSGVERWTYD